MRDYARFAPTFWIRGSGKKLRGHPEAQVVAVYLFTAPGATMIGLYHLALPTLAHETGLSLQAARCALARVCDIGIAMYDEEEELVFLPEAAKYQVGPSLSGNDPRKKGVENALEPFYGHPFAAAFAKRYREAYSIVIPQKYEAPSKPLRSGLLAPLAPLRSQAQEQAQAQDQEQAKERIVGFENPPPLGAGLSPVSKVDPEPLADVPAPAATFGDLAPVDPPDELSVAAAWQAVEPAFDPVADPMPVPEEPEPAEGQPEPHASPPAEEPATVTVPAPVLSGPATVPFAPSNPGQAALPLALAPASAKHDPVAAIFAEYVSAWKRVTKGRRPPKLDDKRRRLTLARLREFAEDDLKAAARGIFASEWHITEKQTGYDLTMRDAAHVERFMQCDDDARSKADAAERAKQGVPDWLSGAARPSKRVVSALRLRGTEPQAPGETNVDIQAIVSDIGSVEV